MLGRLPGLMLLAGSCVLAGCSPKPAIPGLTQATGMVTYQGTPVEGATVIFAPEGEGRAATGRTDATGRFRLTTLTSNDGALSGRYRVGIAKTEVTGGDLSREEAQAYVEQHGHPPEVTVREVLPEKYKAPNGSGLSVEISADGSNEFTFDLKE